MSNGKVKKVSVYFFILIADNTSNMNTTLNQAEKWLTELGIQTCPRANTLYVSRDGMVAAIGESEEKSYAEILKALKEAVSSKLFWGGKDDNWLWLESF